MGQTLSEPVTDKESSYCRNDLYRVGSSCMQGWRIKMEDSHTHILSLPDDPGSSFFAVYDGHGGATVAQYAGKHLHKFILKRPEYQSDIEKALKQAFLDIDKDMLCKESWGEQMAGSTAVVVLIKDNHLYCANAGDSRAIACINGEVEVLSLDHKPNNELETRRINEGGGWVEFNRVNGNLALSRALGDFVFKRNSDKKPEDQIVTAYPDVETREITEDWEFLVLACDGIWDVMSNKEVSDFCRKRIGMGMYPETICEELMNHCLAPDCQMGGLGGDNMTVVLVCFLHKKPYATLVERCSSSNSDELLISSSNSTSSISSTGLPLEDDMPVAVNATTSTKTMNTLTTDLPATTTLSLINTSSSTATYNAPMTVNGININATTTTTSSSSSSPSSFLHTDIVPTTSETKQTTSSDNASLEPTDAIDLK